MAVGTTVEYSCRAERKLEMAGKGQAKVVKATKPKYISCIIQINLEDGFVSNSPYLHVFDGLENIHHQIAEQELQNCMEEIGYQLIQTLDYPLPNGKKLVQLDFRKNNETEK